MAKQVSYIIDFDNTFTQVEALDELARISQSGNPGSETVFAEIENLTNLAMEGKMSFSESLAKRIELLNANVNHLEQLISFLKQKVSKSFARNKSFLKENANNIYIVSGGFKEFIIPVVSDYHIKKEHIYANTFVTTGDGKIVGYDKANPLSEEGGKVKLLKNLQLQGELLGIGDGYSDYQLKESGMVTKFYAFTENIARSSVTEKADHITPSLDEFLYLNNLKGKLSYPKNRIVCLVIGDCKKEIIEQLKQDGLTVKHKKSLDTKYLKEASIIITDTPVDLTAKILTEAKKLRCLGIYGNTTKPDLELFSKSGVVVFTDNDGIAFTNRILSHINEGLVIQSCNFPDLLQSSISDTDRIVLIVKNRKETLPEINNVIYENGFNVHAVSLRSSGTTSLLAIDVVSTKEKQSIKELKKLPSVIHARVLYQDVAN